jgi:hypothetical protein
MSPTARLLAGMAFIIMGLFYIRFRHGFHDLTAKLGFTRPQIETRGERVAFTIRYVVLPLVFIVVGIGLAVLAFW